MVQPNESASSSGGVGTTDLQLPSQISPAKEEFKLHSHPSLMTNETDCFESTGRRIVNIPFFFQKLKTISNHGPLGCTVENLDIIKEQRKGLISIFTVACNMCNAKFSLPTDTTSKQVMDVNTAAVSGAMCIGIGFRQLEELTSGLNIPSMSQNTYAKCHDKVCEGWEETALKEMAEAAKEEADLAIARGDVGMDGIPIIPVVADGQWAKRAYKNSNYSSLSGVAAIVGYHTRKILYLGVRNRYCTMCNRAKVNNTEPKPHACFKNWDGSASSMEADIVTEGFKNSVEMYGIKYGTLIADGDSSVYNRILSARPYDDLTVEKIECRNHILRNYGNRLKDIASNSKFKHIKLRQAIGSNIVRMRTAVVSAARHWREMENMTEHEKILAFRKDAANAPNHVFGDHSNCSPYFCEGSKPNEKNLLSEMIESGLYAALEEVQNHWILRHARHLLKDIDSNCAEQFNSVVVKFMGAKRVNYCLKRSYSARSHAAVVSLNCKTPLSKLHRIMYKVSPGKFTKKLELKRKRLAEKAAMKSKQFKKRRCFLSKESRSKKHYGPNSEKPDLQQEDLEEEISKFLSKLPHTQQEIVELERGTLLQRDSGQWKEVRRKLLTASNFGPVCRRLPHTACNSLVHRIIYADFDTDGMLYGRENEKNAIRDLEEEVGVKIDQCGLFVDPEHPFLGATPDGIIGETGIAEVKCPSSASNMTPDEAILARKCTFWSVNKQTKEMTVNKKHHYFYQVQGQLHVTRRQYCYFAMWTKKGIKVEKIEKDNNFWETQMQEKLLKFYMDCLLPELVDPRIRRSMPIKNPPYILKAIEEHKKRKSNQENSVQKKRVRRQL